jgi:hypothetical protein
MGCWRRYGQRKARKGSTLQTKEVSTYFSQTLLASHHPAPCSFHVLCLLNDHNPLPSGEMQAVRYECGTATVQEPEEPGSISFGSLLLLDCIDLQVCPSPGGGKSDGEASDEDDVEYQPATGLHRQRLGLIGCRDSPETFWAVHSSGCWSVALPWLHVLARSLSNSSRWVRQCNLDLI